MAKSKKMSMTNIIWTAVLAVALILVIVGICVNYVGVTGSINGGVLGSASNTEYVKLFDMTGSNQPDAAATWGTLSVVTAIITIVLCVAGIAIALLKMVRQRKNQFACKPYRRRHYRSRCSFGNSMRIRIRQSIQRFFG